MNLGTGDCSDFCHGVGGVVYLEDELSDGCCGCGEEECPCLMLVRGRVIVEYSVSI